MARMVLDQPAGLPAGAIADQLHRSYPLIRWQVGDGPHEGIVPLDRATSIMGRSEDGLVLMGIERVEGQLEAPDDAPPHRFHVRLTGPSTDDVELRQRLLLLIGDALARQGGGALQLERAGPWFRSDVLARGAAELASEPARGHFSALHFFQAAGHVADLARPREPSPPVSFSPAPTAASFPRGNGDRPLFGRKKSE